jgi:toxin-antitoxin system PIN domain toxin
VKVLDLNLLLYAVNRDSPTHARAKAWVEAALTGEEPIGIPWVVLLGFLRISTSSRVMPRPLSPDQSLAIVDGWLAQPVVEALAPGLDHWRVMRQLLLGSGTAGNLTTDAHLAALAIENGAELCSTDSDFGRFPHLRWTNPLEARRS